MEGPQGKQFGSPALLDCYAISLLSLFACRQSVSLYGLQANPGCFPKFHKGEMFVVKYCLIVS